MAAERQVSSRKRERQPVSIPFIWEEKPGTPKKDWKPGGSSQTKPLPLPPFEPPQKLVASIPFEWEEKPGKPLPCFSDPPKPPPLQTPIISQPRRFFPPDYYDHHDNGGDSHDEDDGPPLENSDDEIDSCSYETEDSFSSATSSLLANCLIPTAVLSSAIPAVDLQSPDDSQGYESDGSTSSYATGTASLAGSSFLERLFPALAQAHRRVDCSDKERTCNTATVESEEFKSGNNNGSTRVTRPQLTLGELIMMSRRISCGRKLAMKMHKQNSSLDFMKGNALGCFGGAGNSIIGLQRKWKRQFNLGLV